MRYYAVTCKRGHCGRGRYDPITFAFGAVNSIKAMDLAKAMPGVKHTQPILDCREISYAEYLNYRKKSAYHRTNGGIDK